MDARLRVVVTPGPHAEPPIAAGRPDMRHVRNPPNPYREHEVEWLGEPPPVELEVWIERAKSCVTENASPDVPFRFGVNPYRGCQHACAYCYARRTHEYLGFGAGTDFDSKIVVKENAAELLDRELGRPRLAGQTLAFSGVTDPYQPLEASYRLTLACLEVAHRHGNPVGVVTKGALVRRDAELLARMAGAAGASVQVSIPFADDERARALEPWASSASQRFETIRVLAAAGVAVGVAVAPLIPGLNERDVPAILERARAAGASSAWTIPLRLPGSVRPVFEERLRAAFPERADKVLRAQREWRGGRWNDPRFGRRFSGTGARFRAALDLFDLTRRKLGFPDGAGTAAPGDPARAGERPTRGPRQGELF